MYLQKQRPDDLCEAVNEDNTTNLGTQESLDENMRFMGNYDVALSDFEFNVPVPDTEASRELEIHDSSFSLIPAHGSSSTLIPFNSTDNVQPSAKKRRMDELPTHLLAHHYSRELAG
ncbi:hypothetical protein PENANT_c018G09686 [Penicillium antarcticum]|uniref:Uncharacterized protein n=1 Tax=Penicillium antarcticum TaxID=416450 RepID=A0A1V6Q1G9_9EURO|nr:hypothetical protein PENANT_c018G09686 [Penicillium antarcticum]